MSVDWSKYPPLPKPPKLPEWRDTPEHEAYWPRKSSAIGNSFKIKIIHHPPQKNVSGISSATIASFVWNVMTSDT